MPPSCPRGRASLCLSASPTTPIMHQPPAVATQDGVDTVNSGLGHQYISERGWKCGGPSKCDASMLWLMGAEGAMGFGRGKK